MFFQVTDASKLLMLCSMLLNVIPIAIAAFVLPDAQISDGFTVANASLRRQMHIGQDSTAITLLSCLQLFMSRTADGEGGGRSMAIARNCVEMSKRS